MLQYRARGQIAGKRRQAHTEPNRNVGSVTGASEHAPFLEVSSHRVLDLGYFMGVEEYGATWVITGSSGTCYAFGILASGMAFFITRAYPHAAKNLTNPMKNVSQRLKGHQNLSAAISNPGLLPYPIRGRRTGIANCVDPEECSTRPRPPCLSPHPSPNRNSDTRRLSPPPCRFHTLGIPGASVRVLRGR